MKTVVLLFVFIFSSEAYSNELKLHFLRSPLGVNWKSPWTLTTSILKNQLVPFKHKRPYSISHVFAEIKCDSNGQHILRGMTSADNEDRDLVLKKKYGLATMFHTYKGKLEKDESILKDLAPYNGSRRRSELTIKVSGEACERMLDYAQEYEDLGYGHIYSGLQLDPLKREGAGCSAFGVSFMRVAGLMDEFTNEWKTIIDVPKKFIGGPMTGRKVSIFYILARPFARWSSRVPHIHLEAWDPEAMHSWVKKTYFEIRNGQYEGKWPANISRYKNTFKVELDMENRPTPEGSFWLN